MYDALEILSDSLDAWGMGAALVMEYETLCPVTNCESLVSNTKGSLMGLSCQAGHNGAQMFGVIDREEASLRLAEEQARDIRMEAFYND